MHKLFRFVIMPILVLTIEGFTPAAAGQDDEVQPPAPFVTSMPDSWDPYHLDEETIDIHKGERVRKFCLDKDFQAFPQDFDRKVLRGGIDFLVVDKTALIITLPKAGNFLVETSQCGKSLNRTKFIRFAPGINRTRLNRCVKRRGPLVIQTRMHNSGFKTCEVRGVFEWNGPIVRGE